MGRPEISSTFLYHSLIGRTTHLALAVCTQFFSQLLNLRVYLILRLGATRNGESWTEFPPYDDVIYDDILQLK